MHVLHRLGHAFHHQFKSTSPGGDGKQIQSAVEYLQLADRQITSLLDQWPNITDHLLWSVVVKASLADALLQGASSDSASDVVLEGIDLFNELLIRKRLGDNYIDQDIRQIHYVLSNLAVQCMGEMAPILLDPIP